MTPRTASIQRDTLETRIKLELDLDGSGRATLESGVPFLDHMLDQVARHGRFDLSVHCDGDTRIDDHHSVEDIGIALGSAVPGICQPRWRDDTHRPDSRRKRASQDRDHLQGFRPCAAPRGIGRCPDGRRPAIDQGRTLSDVLT